MRISARTKLAVALGLAGALALSAATPSLARTKHKHHPRTDAAQTHAPAAAHANANGLQSYDNAAALPGYSARPPGMCWNREGGGGQELSGNWAPCR